MPTLLVSGAGLGDSSVYGTTSVANAAGGALTFGWDSSHFGEGNRVSPDAHGRDVSFDFVVTTTQLGNNVRLDFDPQRPIPIAGIAPPGLGTPSVVNKALGIFGQGWLDEAVGGPLASFDLAGRKVNFDFTVVFTQPGNNIGLYFGGGPVVSGVGAKLQTVFGTATLTNAAQAAYPDGIAPPVPMTSVKFVGRGGSLDFNFVLDYTPPYGAIVRLDFDPLRRPIPVAGINATLFGTTTLTNKAFGIFPPSIASMQVGFPIVSFDLPGRSVNFDFVDLYTPITGINVAFAFGESKGVKPASWDASAFGTPNVYIPAFVAVEGWDSLQFGWTTIRAGAIRPVGFEDSVFGEETAVGAFTKYVRPYFIYDFAIGVPVLTYKNRVVVPGGRDQLTLGKPTVRNTQLAIYPAGFANERVGDPTFFNNMQEIDPIPFDTLDLTPAAKKEDRMTVRSSIGPNQIVQPPGFITLLMDDGSAVTYWLQYIKFDGLMRQDMAEYGLPYVGERVQRISVPGLTHARWGLPTLATNQQIWVYDIAPRDPQVGQPQLILANVHAVQGFTDSVVSEPTVRLAKQYVQVGVWSEKDSLSQHLVFNSRQYLLVDNLHYFDFVPYFGDHDVRNRNRVIGPYSIDPPRISNVHTLRLLGWQVLPEVGDQGALGVPMVAYRIRYIKPDPWRFAGYTDVDHYVHNAAQRAYPVGFDAQQHSLLHRVWFNAQTIAPRYIEQDGYGKPWASFSPRWIQQTDSELATKFGATWVSPVVRYVVQKPWPTPTAPPVFGNPILYTHRNVIQAFQISYIDYGRPYVRNVTPEILATLGDSSRFGVAWASHSPRYLAPAGMLGLQTATPVVIFRDRTLLVAGFTQWIVPLPTVWQEAPGRTGEQYINDAGGIGPTSDNLLVGFPTLEPRPVVPKGWVDTEFGTAWVRSMGIRPHWDMPDSFFQFGFPTLNATQTIVEVNKENPDDPDLGSQTQWTRHRISPHTIYCTFDTPAQAIANNPQSPYTWKPLDTGINGLNPPPPWFGEARVYTDGPQTVRPHHFGRGDEPDEMNGERIGIVLITNALRYIYPSGQRITRYGFPTLNHPIKLWMVGEDSAEFGTPTVGITPLSTQWIVVSGGPDTSVVPKQAVENHDRPIYPVGLDATIYGNNDPMVYHYPRGPKQVGGDDMQVFGDETWVSHSPRDVQMDGFESFDEGYTSGSFEERMRVTRGAPKSAYSVGDSLGMGSPVVSYGKAPQRIGPYMIPPPQYCHPHSITGGS